MIGERYTLILRHEMVDPETGKKYQFEPPLAICYSMFDPLERGGVIHVINNMLRQMEHEFLNRFDGGGDDAVPVKHGRWIDPAAEDCYRCSVCEEYTSMEVPRLLYHYCPKCGAKMDGGADDGK